MANSLGLTSKSSSSDTQRSNGIPRSPRKIFHTSSTNRKDNKDNDLPPARESLLANAIPYSAIPAPRPSQLPKTDPFSFDGLAETSFSSTDTGRPVPGFPGWKGSEVDAACSTIRLVMQPSNAAQNGYCESPPKLKPVHPAWEIIPPTPAPAGSRLNRWPVSPPASNGDEDNGDGLYPTLTFAALKEAAAADDDAETMPGSLVGSIGKDDTKPSNQRSHQQEKLPSPISSSPGAELFVFGSPNPRYSVSNQDFQSAASSVLAEMNARLALGGNQMVGMDLLSRASKVLSNPISPESASSVYRGTCCCDSFAQRRFVVHRSEDDRAGEWKAL